MNKCVLLSILIITLAMTVSARQVRTRPYRPGSVIYFLSTLSRGHENI